MPLVTGPLANRGGISGAAAAPHGGNPVGRGKSRSHGCAALYSTVGSTGCTSCVLFFFSFWRLPSAASFAASPSQYFMPLYYVQTVRLHGRYTISLFMVSSLLPPSIDPSANPLASNHMPRHFTCDRDAQPALAGDRHWRTGLVMLQPFARRPSGRCTAGPGRARASGRGLRDRRLPWPSPACCSPAWLWAPPSQQLTRRPCARRARQDGATIVELPGPWGRGRARRTTF